MIKSWDRQNASALGKVIIEFLEYALMFTVIIECNSLFHYSENYRQTTMEVVVTVFAILMAGILLVIQIGQNRKKYREELKRDWPVWSVLLACIFAFPVLNVLRIGAESALRKYVLSFVLFLPIAYLLFRAYRINGKPNELLFKYANLIVILTALNLVVFAAVILQPGIIQAMLLKSRWSSQGYIKELVNYLNVCIVASDGTRTIAGFTFYRNCGFFPEPLMFCIPLITALFTEMFLRKKQDRRVWKWLVLLIAVVTTQSTLGMLLAAGAVGIKLIEGAKPKRRWIMVIAALILVAAAVYALLKQKVDIGGSSTAAHIAHYKAAFKAFLEHPLLGCGFLREDQIILHMSEKHSKGLSNSVAVVLAEGGAFLSLLCMAPFFIGLAQIRSKNSKQIALWALGPLGLYIVTVFHFHLLLMMFMAFGYSMLELIPASSGGKRRMTLADGEEALQVREILSSRERIGAAVIILLGCGAAAALFLSRGFWQTLSRWLQFHQLYLGQSAWKVYFFSLYLILAVLVIRYALRASAQKDEKRKIGVTAWFLLCSTLFAAAYPALYSLASTALDLPTPFGDLFETAALAGLCFGGIAVGWLLIVLLSRSKRLFAGGAAAAVILALGIAAGIRFYVSRLDVQLEEIAPAIKAASAEAKGKIYANEKQTEVKRAISELTYSPARCGAFAAIENASVLTVHDQNLRDLLKVGFQVAELSPEYVLYSNDDSVIDKLQGEGYTFYRYYPFAMAVDNEAAIYLTSGTYTLTAELRKQAEPDAPHKLVGKLRVTRYYGAKQVKSLSIYADKFDDEGYYRAEITFTAGKWEGMEYQLIPEEGIDLQADSLTLAETPQYLTERKYDGRFLVVRESYFEPSGEPYYQSQGYAAISKDYNRAGRIVKQSYYDGDGEPVIIKSGYASFTRKYNRQGRLWKESYFDENGDPCTLKEGYAAFEREYDRKGNITVLRYLDGTGRPVITTSGYAETRRSYDKEERLREQSYYDAGGANVLLPDGYWMEKREYDEAGNVAIQRYYDTSGQPVITAMGYAEIHKEYNEKKKVVLEEYFGVNGEPIALPGGTASQRIEYGSNGKVSARHYYDLNGEEITPES